MKNIWNWIKGNPNRTMFLIPILLVAGISISHVVSWYNIANPLNWAIYLSIAIEVGAMTALVAATNRIKGGVWFMFGLVTIIQMIGNIFYSFKEIDENGDLFKSWVELTGPFWDMFTDSTDIISMKRWLAFLEGGLLPIISLTSLHFFVKYEKPEDKTKENNIDEDIRKMYPANVEGSKEFNEVNEIEETNEDIIIDEPIIENVIDLKEEEIEKDTLEDNVGSEYFDNYPIPVIDEDVPESNIILESTDIDYASTEEAEKEWNNFITQDKSKNNTLGEELNKTWLNIIKNRKNNGIDRI